MRFVSYPDRDMLAIDLANLLAGELVAALDHQDRALFAVPGGGTPGPVFDLLSATELDWSRVDITLTDERWVPDDHPRSNAALLRGRLLVGQAAQARLLPLYLPSDQPEDSVETIAKDLRDHLPISVCVLGMGQDMHTASLFPKSVGLAQALHADAPLLCAMHPDDQEPRLTLSAAAINGALSKHLLITGDDKRAALVRAQELPAEEAPVSAVLEDTLVHWAP